MFTSCYGQTIEWQNTIGGNEIDWVSFIELTNDGNYIAGGYSYSNISRDKSENSRGVGDFWILKIDNISGTIIWQKTLGGIDFDHLTSAKETSDGGYILGGYSSSGISGEKTDSSRGGDDYWVIKLDINRNIVWQKTYGGIGTDRLTSLITTGDGGYIIAGSSDSNISGEKNENSRGNLDMWIMKIDAIGTIMWQKTYGGTNNETVESVIKSPDGNYLLAGSSDSNISGDKTENSRGLGDYWILKINPLGNIIWQKTLGGNNGDYSQSIVATQEGDYIVGGHSSSNISGDKTQQTNGNSDDIWLIKLNTNGQLIWQKNIGGNDTEIFENMVLTSDNGLIIASMSYSGISGSKTEASRGDRDYWAVKLDSNGVLEWDKTLGGDNSDQTQSVLQTNDGAFVIIGWSMSNISGDKLENKSGLQDFWIVKLKVCSQNQYADTNSPICNNGTIQFTASGGSNYSWTGPNGFVSIEQNPVILNATQINEGQYNCYITDIGGCNSNKLVNVVITSHPLPTANSPQKFCLEEKPTLNNIEIFGENIKWYDSIVDGNNLSSGTLITSEKDIYASQTINGCESQRYLIKIEVKPLSDCGDISDDTLMYPIFFTPNGDGYNDTWKIKFPASEAGSIIEIFDRFGKLITKLNTNSNGWDGNYNGEELPSSDYWFVINRLNGSKVKGHFSLKR